VVFGRVIKGMDVVDRIKAVATTSKELTQEIEGQELKAPAEDVPGNSVVIRSARVLRGR